MTEHNEMVERVGEAALENLLDRKGLGDMLNALKYDDVEIWNEIVEESGRAAIAALEPTAAMKAVGNEALLEFKPVDYIYRAMNAEGLKP